MMESAKNKGLAALSLRRGPLLLVAAAALVVTALAGVIAFQDNIARFGLNPRTPFQIASPPPAPDYNARPSWALWPDEPVAARAEVFYVHSTTHYLNDSWNAPIGDSAADAQLRRAALPNEAGPFLDVGPVFAPLYREATLFSFFTHKFDGVAARKLAYEDVKAAFARYLETADPRKPLVLVGYGQGGLHAQGLLKDYFQTSEELRGRLAAAYIVDQATPLSLFTSYFAKTPHCRAPGDIRCVVAFIDYEPQFKGEMNRARARSMVWAEGGGLRPTEGDALLCVNPLSWTATTDRIDADRHLGAASATGLALGSRPPAMAKIVGAQCVDGVLIVDRPAQPFLRRPQWFADKWRVRTYNLFYYDLKADADRRIAAAAIRMEEEYRILEPIDESVDVDDSPIHKTPH